MNQTIHLEIGKDEAARLSDVLEQCVKALRESNERGERIHTEIDRLSAETRVLLKQSAEMLNVEISL